MEGTFQKIQDVCSLGVLAANLESNKLFKSTSENSKGRPYFKLKEAVFGEMRVYVSNAIWEDKKVDASCYVSLFHHTDSEDPNSKLLWVCKASEADADEFTVEL